MVTMALMQGVLNTFVILLSRVVGRIIDSAICGNREGGGIGYFVIVFVLDMVFGLFASVIAMWFSRQREFRADAGGATLAGREKMIAALERLAADPRPEHPAQRRSPRSASRGGVGRRLEAPVHEPSAAGPSASPRCAMRRRQGLRQAVVA